MSENSRADQASIWQRSTTVRILRSIVTALSQRARRHNIDELLNESQLPTQPADLIRQVVRNVRLWRSERHEVEMELIAHFRDGLDAGRSPGELVEEFGNAEQVAKLIRRAKKRNRPAWWRATKRSFQSIALIFAVLIVFYLGLTIRFYTGEPTISRDYVTEINTVPAAVPAEDRAWPVYREAMTQLRADVTLSELRGLRPDDERWPELRSALRAHQDTLAQVRRAAAMPALGFVAEATLEPEDREFFGNDAGTGESRELRENRGLLGIQLPHFSPLRNVAQLLSSDAFLAVQADDSDRARENIVAMIRIASHANEHPTLINQLVNYSMLSITFQTLSDIIADSPMILTDDDLQIIAHTIAAHTGTEAIGMDLTGERMFFEDVVQRLYTDDGRGGGRLTASGMELFEITATIVHPVDMPDAEKYDDHFLFEALRAATGPAFGFVMANRREMMRKYDEIMSAMEREMAEPLWRAESRAEDRIQELAAGNILQRARYQLLILMMPAIRRSAVSAELITQRRDAMQAAIALELYRRRHGDWPEALADLTPSLLPRVPVDRFDGRPLRYVVRDGRAVLYSIGTNRVDNGGVPAIGREGEPDDAAAQRWIPADQLDERTNVPDGDWVLWRSR